MRNETQLFKALADETRLKMVALLLRHGELCVCDFEEGLGISQSKASRHLRYLQHASLLEDRREAVWVYYRINRKPSALQKAVLKAVETLLSLESIREVEVRFEKWLKSKSCRPLPKQANAAGARLL